MARSNNKGITPPKQRISSGTGKIMIITALGFDFFQGIIGFIPFVGFVLSPIISVFIWLTFLFWLKFHGVNLTSNTKRTGIMVGGFLFELIPMLNILPGWTLTIFLTIFTVQRKDKKKIKEFYKNAGESSRRVPTSPTPLHQ